MPSSQRSPDDAVILSACRTAVGRFLGGLKDVPAPRLGAAVIAEAVRRAGIEPAQVDDAIMGNVLSAGLGQAPARQAAIHAGLPVSVVALTINKVCGSGLEAVTLAARAVRSGDSDVAVAGGMESMSGSPHVLRGVREGLRMGPGTLVDTMIHDGLWDPYNDFHMGMTGEVVAERYAVSRQQQDEWALESHQKALAAIDAGRFRKEIVGVDLKGRKGETIRFETDEGPRRETSLEALGKLRPAFKPDGTVTAGNAPGVNDGAAALVVTTRAWAAAHGRKPIATIRASASHGLAPELVMMAPEGAIRKLLQRAGWSMGDVDLFEINEAFAVQQCALGRQLEIPRDRHNVNGGAVALGHPIGASGARVLVTLLHALEDRGQSRGVAALCLGGGNAVAMAVEMESA